MHCAWIDSSPIAIRDMHNALLRTEFRNVCGTCSTNIDYFKNALYNVILYTGIENLILLI